MFRTKRAYEDAAPGDGQRYLVDRLWPRGVTKTSLHVEAWLKDVAPDSALRKWFNHDPAKWDQFRRRYFAQLDSNPDSWAPLVSAALKGPVTLIYSAHDPEHNNAVALAEYLTAHAGRRHRNRPLRPLTKPGSAPSRG